MFQGGGVPRVPIKLSPALPSIHFLRENMARPQLLPRAPQAPLSLVLEEEELMQTTEDFRVEVVKEEELTQLRGVGRVRRCRAADAGGTAA